MKLASIELYRSVVEFIEQVRLKLASIELYRSVAEFIER